MRFPTLKHLSHTPPDPRAHVLQEAAGTLHLDVVRELKASTEAKVLLAVDSYNEFFQPSMWHYMDDKVCVDKCTTFGFETDHVLECGENGCCCCRCQDVIVYALTAPPHIPHLLRTLPCSLQLETPHFTATNPLVPPVEITQNGYTFPTKASEGGDGEDPSSPQGAGKNGLRFYSTEQAGKCLPTPPVNGMVVCATSGRYPPVTKFIKKTWAPFEEAAGRMIHGVSVRIRS